jgi:hypothetical protein
LIRKQLLVFRHGRRQKLQRGQQTHKRGFSNLAQTPFLRPPAVLPCRARRRLKLAASGTRGGYGSTPAAEYELLRAT